jgi:predicted RNA methylase
VLYRKVAEAAGLREGCQDVVLDLYCGTGTIGLSLASRCKKVHGVEIVGGPPPVHHSACSDAMLHAMCCDACCCLVLQCSSTSPHVASALFLQEEVTARVS